MYVGIRLSNWVLLFLEYFFKRVKVLFSRRYYFFKRVLTVKRYWLIFLDVGR